MQSVAQDILSQITVFGKYAKYIPELERRETWDEIVKRYETMLKDKYPMLKDDIEENINFIQAKEVLPSMRSLQFAGKPIALNNSRIYNCAYLPIDDIAAFSETMFLLLGGTGVGYSVQFHHIAKLPEITKPTKSRRYLVGDSIEGWADAIKMLMKSYLGRSNARPLFDFRDIRPKGHALVTSGGKAPGPEPLERCLFNIEQILKRKNNGDKLTSLEAHDILCHIADAVLAGGIRRAAMIALFSFDDEAMLTAKFGTWWELNPQRGRANNSVVILRNRIKEQEFKELWTKVENSHSGEPGLYFTDDIEYGTNPCAEISLRPFQFCNLTEINASNITSQIDLNTRAAVASFFGTLQAGFTDFHYLRDVWKTTTEKDALIGVGMTGIASNVVMQYSLVEATDHVLAENARVANIIGINKAARTTTVKPSGTSSCVLGTSSGIHAWHNDYYIRRQRINKNESLYMYFYLNHPELLEEDQMNSNQAIIVLPQKAPEGSILRTESVLDLLERVKLFNIDWVRPGYRAGSNHNNVSATISVKDDEWKLVGTWMWENRHIFNGLSVLPYDGGSYIQAPFEDITENQYNEMILHLTAIDITKVVELDDSTSHSQEPACFGESCEIPV
jgi:ribonucleoside-triphosphate reductase (thioredoxin)